VPNSKSYRIQTEERLSFGSHLAVTLLLYSDENILSPKDVEETAQ